MKFNFSYALIATTVLLLLLIAGTIYALSPTALPSSARHPAQPATPVHIITSNSERLQFALQTPRFQANAGHEISIAGLNQSLAQPGAPALPYYATYIALPPEAEITVQVQAYQIMETAVHPIPPAPDMLFDLADGVGVAGPPQKVYQQDSAVYGRDALYPDALFTVSEPMYYRDIRLVALQLFPARYNPATGRLWQAQNLEVTVSFSGARYHGLQSSPHHNNKGLEQLILNYDASHSWRSLPANVINAVTTDLPIGAETFKITVNQDGIYQVCQPELAAAGMNVGSVNPNTIQMLYRGENFSYQFIGNSNNSFEAHECIRFYGWKFEGPRTEKQFVTDNVYWLWANGTANRITEAPNQPAGSLRTSVWYTQTKEPELDYSSTWTDQWHTFDNEPDAFYWERINTGVSSRSYTIELPDPVTSAAPAASLLLEFMSPVGTSAPVFTVSASLNGAPNPATRTWNGPRNVNAIGSVPAGFLQNGVNNVAVDFNLGARIFLNRITVEYMRHLIAVNDQFILIDEVGGNPLQVSGFSNSNALVWNISDLLAPVALDMSTGVSGGTYTFGQNHAGGSKFIATTTDNIKTVLGIEEYVPPNLNPPDGRTEWLLITHPSLLTPATQLAAHRANAQFGGLDTQIVNIQDIINQYGYGLPLPAAVRNYLMYALGNWTVAPSYVVMFGDAHLNPRRLPCAVNCGSIVWDLDAPYLVMTDLPFIDRFQGMVPSDHTFVLLAGNDPLADMAIGRIAVEDTAQAANAVRKIITYESDPDTTPANPPFLFIADNDDPQAGYFCAENMLTASRIPASFLKQHICQGTAAYPDSGAVRNAMFPAINAGVHVVNYRGHGGRLRWAGGSDPIMTTADTVYWENENKPAVILSADCLDGHFAWPASVEASISEVYQRYDFMNRSYGSAATWSSTGLGFTFEHTILHGGFYDGLFLAYGKTMGNAISYAKLHYYQGGHHASELYTFTLQGDPAMQLPWAPDPPPTPTPSNTPPPGASLTPIPQLDHQIYLPAIQKP